MMFAGQVLEDSQSRAINQCEATTTTTSCFHLMMMLVVQVKHVKRFVPASKIANFELPSLCLLLATLAWPTQARVALQVSRLISSRFVLSTESWSWQKKKRTNLR